VEALFRSMNLEQMMEKVASAGYQGFEFGNWRAQDAAAITKLKNKLGLECACLVGNRAVNPKGMTLVDPADREAFLDEIKASTEAAKRFETTRLVTLTGNELPGVSRTEQHKSIVEGLKAAHDVVAPQGVTLIVEPLNTLVNHQGYYLNHTAEAFEIVREVGSPMSRSCLISITCKSWTVILSTPSARTLLRSAIFTWAMFRGVTSLEPARSIMETCSGRYAKQVSETSWPWNTCPQKIPWLHWQKCARWPVYRGTLKGERLSPWP
jgi:hypothetical protein